MNRQELEGMMRKEIGRNICYCRAGGGAGSIILLELDNKDSYWMSGYWWLFYNKRIICTYEDDCTALIGKVPKNLIDYILRLKSFELALKTSNFALANSKFKEWFINNSPSAPTIPCGCR